MKFTCNQQTLNKEVAKASSFSAGKNSLSVTSCVLLDAHDDIIEIKAHDGKSGFHSFVPAHVEENGAVAVFADKLSSILSNLPSVDLEVSLEGDKLQIIPSSGRSLTVKMRTMQPDKFPTLPEPKEGYTEVTMKLDELKEMSDSVSFAVGEDSTRAFLTGVYMEMDDDNLVMVATDGRIMAHTKRSGEYSFMKEGIIIPVKFLQNLKILDGETISISIGEGTIFATTESQRIHSSLIAGPYPAYRKVIPSSVAHGITLNTKELDRAIALTSIMTDAKTKRLVIGIENDKLAIAGEDSDYGNSQQTIEGTDGDGNVKAMFNVLLLSPCIKKIPTETVRIGFNSHQTAWTFRPVGTEDTLYVIMPMSV